MRLLDEDAFPNAKSIVKEQVAPYLIRTEKREAIDNSGNKLFKSRITHLVEMSWDERHTMQKELYKRVTAYVSKIYNKAQRNRKKNMCLIFLLIIMQRMVTSSTAAVRQSLERRLEILKAQSTKTGLLTEDDIATLDIEDGVEEALEAISLDIDEEIAELEDIISVAKQAEFQHPDVKIEYLLNTVDEIIGEDQNQKIIIFTEFVATQQYLEHALVSKGYTIAILNGSMSIDERNIALKDFRDRANVFISTDAGGEGLNLQFSNIIINYDLPWNPMKIEQRCGRVDRIGQQRDVHIFNFIIKDTVENRVRQVLEEKLSVIFKEMGVDKYSDVLDSEVAECDFTEVYMRSISHPSRIDESLYPVESEVKQQLANAKKYKDVIREEKDLTTLVGSKSDFDVEEALRRVLMYYDCWQGNPPTLFERIGINDDRVTKHLSMDITQDKVSPIMSVAIRNFPNEDGYFMLWELSISDDEADRRIIPIFVNRSFVLRPLAGKRIMDVFLDPNSKLTVKSTANISDEDYSHLEKLAMDFSHDAFIELKDRHMKQNQESYDKYMYALKLRIDAAQQIGIENIRESRMTRLKREMQAVEAAFKNGQTILPDFRLVLLARLEA